MGGGITDQFGDEEKAEILAGLQPKPSRYPDNFPTIRMATYDGSIG
jgi:hypothetical protein